MMQKLIIDLSKPLNHSDRETMIDLTPEEIEDRERIRDDQIQLEEKEKAEKEKRKNLVDKIAKKLDVDPQGLMNLFGIADADN